MRTTSTRTRPSARWLTCTRTPNGLWHPKPAGAYRGDAVTGDLPYGASSPYVPDDARAEEVCEAYRHLAADVLLFRGPPSARASWPSSSPSAPARGGSSFLPRAAARARGATGDPLVARGSHGGAKLSPS